LRNLFALPVNAVERVKKISASEIFTVEGRTAISLDGRVLPLLELGVLLGRAGERDNKKSEDLTALVVNQGGDRAAFIIDGVKGEQEIIVKSLGRPLRRMKNFAGGAILGDGSVLLLLNPADLLRGARNEASRSQRLLPKAEAVKTKRKILIVDDSITTRTLEKNILEMAGYEVCLARDGAEGLELARTSGCELVISDIQMPRLNGIELTTQIKSDAALRHLPVILVSSLDTQEDKARGAHAGADAYIVKGQFDQKSFLEVVESMLAQ
jgi:two-component system chemotaxis sensor kinase CheA